MEGGTESNRTTSGLREAMGLILTIISKYTFQYIFVFLLALDHTQQVGYLLLFTRRPIILLLMNANNNGIRAKPPGVTNKQSFIRGWLFASCWRKSDERRKSSRGRGGNAEGGRINWWLDTGRRKAEKIKKRRTPISGRWSTSLGPCPISDVLMWKERGRM